MADPRSRDVQEDLTIQQVILESLESESFDGVEQERAETEKEIKRLKALLIQAQLRERRASSDHQEQGNAHLPPAVPQSAAASPVEHRWPSAALTTPRKPKMEDDAWGSPAFLSPPNRKRDYGSAFSGTGDGPSKSRCITPAPSGDRRPGLFSESHSGLHDLDFIDLTGVDTAFDSTIIVEQIKQENMLKQESADRDLALRLSSQPSPPRHGPSIPAPDPAHPNAFSMLMATQMSNALQPGDGVSWQTVSEIKDEGSDDPFSLGPMPGAYSAPSHQPFWPDSGGPAMGGFNPASTMLYPNGTPTLPSSGELGLFETINRTSMFDYSAHLDHEGNPLPERLSTFLHDAFHDPRVTEKELDDLLRNIRPDMDIPERNRDGTPAGLKAALYPHQELAVSWMRTMEEGTNKGGILADDMGLGKTITTLALMLARPAKSRPKTNLIIGPLSLIRQWEDEITKKTKLSHRLSVFVYHSRKATTEDLLKYDVVLTTYGTIAQEHRRLEKFMDDNADRHVDFNDRATGSKFPLLHPSKAEFYRVILDEAQCIKNKETKTAKACHRLRSTYRWCLTGTPMMNGVIELFSLVHFLRIKPYCVWERFRQAFGVLIGRRGDPKTVAMSRLRALLKAIMLRRKKDSQLDGKPILKLPSKCEEIVYAELSPDERGFYKQLEEKSQVQFSKYLREGTIGKNYSNILVLLLRMRQACCHPHLNLDVDDACPVSNEDMVKLVESLDKSTVERIKAMEAFECPICFDAVQSPSFFIPCGHDSCNDCLTRLVDNAVATNLQAGDESDRAKCPVCRGIFDPKKCFTYEAFRSVHMPESVVKKSESDFEDSDGDDDSESEDEADDEIDEKGNLRGFVVEDDEQDDLDRIKSKSKSKSTAEAPHATEARVRKQKDKKKVADVKPSMLRGLRAEAAKNRDAYKRYMRYLRKTWMPAAKVTACMGLLRQIQESGEKVIVFSQWTLLLDLLQVAMFHENFKEKPTRYDGSMSGAERAKAASDFRDRRDVKVMLVSLRAGNAGLNLTAANNVIIMDPFWNPYIEMQAIDRAHRIGQQRDVKVYRILTSETVEDRIIALQERKKEIVEAALDETESMKIGRLNVNELKFLFNTRG